MVNPDSIAMLMSSYIPSQEGPHRNCNDIQHMKFFKSGAEEPLELMFGLSDVSPQADTLQAG
jgi:hypothetical protein